MSYLYLVINLLNSVQLATSESLDSIIWTVNDTENLPYGAHILIRKKELCVCYIYAHMHEHIQIYM